VSLIVSLLLSVMIEVNTNVSYMFALLVVVNTSILCYTFVQTLFTDISALKVDRYTLYLAQYIVLFSGSLYYLYSSNLLFDVFTIGVIVSLLILYTVFNIVANSVSSESTIYIPMRIMKVVTVFSIIAFGVYIFNTIGFVEPMFWILVTTVFSFLFMLKGFGGGDTRSMLVSVIAVFPIVKLEFLILGFIIFIVTMLISIISKMIKNGARNLLEIQQKKKMGLPAAPVILGSFIVPLLIVNINMVFNLGLF